LLGVTRTPRAVRARAVRDMSRTFRVLSVRATCHRLSGYAAHWWIWSEVAENRNAG